METGLIRCLDHPRYKGKGKPRRNCLACWRVWLNDPYAFRWQEELTTQEVNTIMMLLGGHI